MGTKLTSAELYARAAAYSSAADHLNLGWTDDPTESAEGLKIATELYKKAEVLYNKADLLASESSVS